MLWDDRIGRRLKLKDFHTLQTIAEVGSMAKAAKLLAMSQPAISKAMADMEHVVGAALLERSSQGVELTESGRILVARGRVIFDEVREGLKDIGAVADPTQGDLRIAAADPLTVVVAEIITQLFSKYPRITYQVTVSDATTTLRQLRDRELEGLDGRTVDAITAGFVSGAHRGRYIPSQQTRMATLYRHCDLDPHAGKPTGIRKFHLGAADDNPAEP